MDELTDYRLLDQARRLREVIGVFSQAARRLDSLGGTIGWVGPASAAYDAAIDALRLEFRMAELHLDAALTDTIRAIR